MKYKAVIFDLDGTLLNTIDDLSNSMNAVLEKWGFPIHDTETYKYFIGNGIRNLVSNALPEDKRGDETVDACLAGMRQEYEKRWAEKTGPYEGIPELLDALTAKGVKMAILSNKADEFTKKIVHRLLPGWKFEAVFGERPSVPRKPDPTAVREIAGLLGLTSRDFLYLGDSGTDMQTAKAAGIYAVGALWGFRKEDELVSDGADALIKHPLELLEQLEYKTKKFFEEVNSAYEKMSEEDWENELAERKEMDNALMDGLEDNTDEEVE